MSTRTLDTRTRKMLRRAQQLDDLQQEALQSELHTALKDMERIETYAYHMAESVADVMRQLR